MDPATIARARMRAQRVWSSDFKDPQKALAHLVAVQAQEFAYARWSLAQRSGDPSSSIVQRAFDDGRILRTHILRPTWHFVAPRDLRWLMRLSGPRIIDWTARRCRELGLDAKTLARSHDVIAGAVAEQPLTRRALAAILERRRLAPDGHRMPYMLMRAELDMIVCSGPLEGKQHTYAAFDTRVPAAREISIDEGLGRLAKRYFASRGPATLKDFSWWSGLPMGNARRAVEVAGPALKRTEVGGRTYLSIDEQPRARPSPQRVDLVQCYDETIIAYGESRDVLWSGRVQFAVPSNPEGFPHVLLRDGRLLGRWRAARAHNDVQVETLIEEKLDVAGRVALDKAIDRYRRFALS
jgi:winged helix DNA-binding protein